MNTGNDCARDVHAERYLSYLQGVRSLSPLSIKSYREDFARWTSFLSREGLEPADADDRTARAFVGTLSRGGMAPSTVNRTVSALRGFYRYLIREGVRETNPFSGIRSVKKKAHLPPFLFEREMTDLLAFEPRDFWDLRDRLILEVLYSTGCRVSELVGMNLDRIDGAGGKVLVTGKGGKDRFVFLGKEALKTLREYVGGRRNHVDANDADAACALFLNRKGGRITQRGVAYLLEKHFVRAGIVKNVSPHTFRHTFATHVLDNGADIRTVQEMLGHASLSTTQVYTHLGIERLKTILADAHPHGKKKAGKQ